ncbi:MAG: hypothetical protein QXP96_04070 [Thermoproteota archaeon]
MLPACCRPTLPFSVCGDMNVDTRASYPKDVNRLTVEPIPE